MGFSSIIIYKIKRYFFGDLVSAYNIDGIPIGWSYSTDINKTTLNRGFVSSADFDNFQNISRLPLLLAIDRATQLCYTSFTLT